MLIILLKSRIPWWWGKWKWSGIHIWDHSFSKSRPVLVIGRPDHNTKFQWNQLFLVILLTEWHADWKKDHMTSALLAEVIKQPQLTSSLHVTCRCGGCTLANAARPPVVMLADRNCVCGSTGHQNSTDNSRPTGSLEYKSPIYQCKHIKFM